MANTYICGWVNHLLPPPTLDLQGTLSLPTFICSILSIPSPKLVDCLGIEKASPELELLGSKRSFPVVSLLMACSEKFVKCVMVAFNTNPESSIGVT